MHTLQSRRSASVSRRFPSSSATAFAVLSTYFQPRIMSTIVAQPTQKAHPRVLSIQSTVSHGYVGNKAATFPLQCMGFNVDAINTVSLSNHPNYAKGFKGQFLSAEEMQNTLQGLEENDLLNHDVVMNGYTRSLDVLHTIKSAVEKVKANNPNAIYVCDPVLGDNGEFYVPQELLDIYKTHLLPIATVITPNYFEVEVLTNLKVNTVKDACIAAAKLHDFGTKIIVMTGQRLNGAEGPQSILISTRFTGEAEHHVLRIDVTNRPGYYFGCGDLFSALITNGIHRAISASGGNMTAVESNADNMKQLRHYLALVLEHSAWAIGKVVEATCANNSKELRIIESIDAYRKIYDDWQKLSIAESSLNTTNTNNASPLSCKSYDMHNEIYKEMSPAHRANGNIAGIIVDMDGTLTMPGLIDFKAMWDRVSEIKPRETTMLAGGILEHISDISDPIAKAKCMDIIDDEELKGMVNCELRHDLFAFLSLIKEKRIRLALSTRNSGKALDHFMEHTGLAVNTFSPALHRNSLEGNINKPDPRVAQHVFKSWKVDPKENSEEVNVNAEGHIWFLGDSIDDMSCGKAAGCKTCLVRTAFNAHLDESSVEIDMVVETLSEWATLVKL